MKALAVVIVSGLALASVSTLSASETLDRARRMEQSGDATGARAALARAAQSAPKDISGLTEYAEFLTATLTLRPATLIKGCWRHSKKVAIGSAHKP